MSEPTPLQMIGRMASDAAARIAAADAKAARAQYAFAAGRFAEFFQAEYEAAEKAINDELERFSGGTVAD